MQTAQDLDALLSAGMSESEANKLSEETFRKLQALLSDTCREEMSVISQTSKLGITVEKVPTHPY